MQLLRLSLSLCVCARARTRVCVHVYVHVCVCACLCAMRTLACYFAQSLKMKAAAFGAVRMQGYLFARLFTDGGAGLVRAGGEVSWRGRGGYYITQYYCLLGRVDAVT